MAEYRTSLGFNFPEETRDRLLSEIEGFYVDVFDEEITELRKEQLLDFISETAAPIIYNKALDDALSWFKTQMDNLEIDYSALYRNVD